MKALTYIEHGKFALTDKPKPQIINARDAIVRVTLGSICTSDLHIKHGSVPRAVPGITVGHEMVGIVEEVGAEVTNVKPGDRVTVNVETFCGECFFCKHGFVNNCTDKNGGWALGCRIDGGQAEFVRVPYADQGLNKIPDSVTDEQALFVGDILATGFWAARISEITNEDTVLIIGAGPTGICTLLCVMLKQPKRIIVCEKDPARVQFVKEHYEKTQQEHPEMKNQRNMNKHYQKQNIKKEYAAARKAGSQTASNAATKNTGKKFSEKAADKIKEFFTENKKVFVWIGLGVMILVLLAAGVSSCTAMFSSTTSSVIASSYLSEDDAMLGAEEQYCRMEAELQRKLDTYESTHDYDEYHFDLDDIEHDPYVLISILSALHEGEFALDEVQGTLQMLFDKQYILTEEVIVETRYRTETDTWTDADGNTHTETYRVPYDYYICYVTLENFNLSHVPVYIMSQDELSMYATYMSGLGNREDLFPNSDYVGKYITNPPDEYTVNPAYLSDAKFATLIEEAEKYLNYPYVWGGSNPDTSFDCSGFVSYVLTNSGLVNTGRLGAQGLYNVCTPVSKANAQPGDLIFFQGTYDTPGVSHVGIYVGDGVMLHCGDPIQYTSINSSYWQSHFYAFGRPNY